ncbi:MAG TPA: EAL domain-containing protein [Ideonella sp.]|uniref:sensor domain-containing protein n=1 Tax=Ideonella sp. TaxID=1929293 RepID=UPI002E32F0C1|nr:EAL domain-containing protein [Ideonella sp.]HEX5683109.1 EAL domain-containing protein [Ideonella sp.]
MTTQGAGERGSALLASEQQYRQLFETNPLPMWVYDLETLRFLDVNEVACHKYGYTRDEFLALTIRDIRPPEDIGAVEESVRTTSAQAFNSGVWRHRLKDGTLIDVEIASHEVVHHGRRARFVCPIDVTQRLRAQAALREREAGLRQAQRMARLTHVVTGPGGTFESWSESLPELVGLAPAQVPGSTREWLQLLLPDDRANFRRKSIEAAITGERVDIEYRLVRPDGSVRHMQQVIEPIEEGAGGAGQRWFSTLQDVTEQKRIEDKVRRLMRMHAVLSGINTLIVRARSREELFREACRIAVEAGAFKMAWIATLDPLTLEGQVVASRGGEPRHLDVIRIIARDDVLGGNQPASRAVRSKLPVVLNDLRADPLLARTLDDAGATGLRAAACLPLVVADRSVGVLTLLADETGVFDNDEVKLLQDLAGDISFALDHLAKEEQLNYLAYYDALTGLANSALLHERLQQHVATADAEGLRLALALFDIERFKTINDTLGRHAGDALLKQVAERLVQAAGNHAHVARIGADHFALVMPGVRSDADVQRAATEHYLHCFGHPFDIEGHELRPSAKIGIALYPNDGADAEALFRNSEVAVRKAKATTERSLFYNPRMTEAVAEKLALENQLRRALENDEFVLHYQPKVDLATRRIVAVEALIRWNSPTQGLVPPMKFIPVMEETGLILEVGLWALSQAAGDRKRWVERSMVAPRIAVNVSAVQLRKPDFVSTVEAALACGAVPHGIDIEITESLAMQDIESTIGKLHALCALGIDISIDDFGTGYSSLAYLARLPAQTLKIDRAFISTMLQDQNSMTLVSTMISLAHSLHKKVVAEGVETEEQARMLRALRCDEMQGYLVSRPLPYDQISALLEAG